MKVKILSIMILMGVGSLAAILWRVDSFIQSDRQVWFESQSRSQSAAVEQTLLRELRATEKSVQNVLILSQALSNEPDWKIINPFFAIAEVSLLNPAQPKVEKYFVQAETPAAQWDRTYLEASLLGMKNQSLTGVRYYIKPFKDNGKQSWVSVLLVDGKKAIALFAKGEVFQGLIDAQRGGFSNLQIVSDLGLAVAHDEPMYIGSQVGEDPVIKKSRSTDALSFTGTFASANQQEIFGSWSQLSQTNLKLIIKASKDELTTARYQVLAQLGMLGLGVMTIFSAVMVWVLNRIQLDWSRELIRVRAAATAGVKPVVNTPVVVTSGPDNSSHTQKEKLLVYSRIASSLGHELRSPLLAILGYSQMIMSKNKDEDVKEATESIIRESKSAKAILDKLFSFAGEGVMDKNEGQVESALLRALQSVDGLMARKGVRVQKTVSTTQTKIPIHMDQLTRAFENILNNAIEAMDRMPTSKELQVVVEEIKGIVRVTIKDNGEGIDANNLERVADPFFTTRSFMNHVGLGLSHSAGVFREHNGEMKISSELGKGTKVEIEFRLPDIPAVLKAEKNLEELPQVIEVPMAVQQQAEAAIKQSFASDKPDLELDVDRLLEMPKEAQIAAVQDDKTIALAPVNDDKTPALEDEKELLKQLENLPVDVMSFAETGKTSNFVDKPDFVIPKKASKLDGLDFEIRRPGTRERGLN